MAAAGGGVGGGGSDGARDDAEVGDGEREPSCALACCSPLRTTATSKVSGKKARETRKGLGTHSPRVETAAADLSLTILALIRVSTDCTQAKHRVSGHLRLSAPDKLEEGSHLQRDGLLALLLLHRRR